MGSGFWSDANALKHVLKVVAAFLHACSLAIEGQLSVYQSSVVLLLVAKRVIVTCCYGWAAVQQELWQGLLSRRRQPSLCIS